MSRLSCSQSSNTVVSESLRRALEQKAALTRRLQEKAERERQKRLAEEAQLAAELREIEELKRQLGDELEDEVQEADTSAHLRTSCRPVNGPGSAATMLASNSTVLVHSDSHSNSAVSTDIVKTYENSTESKLRSPARSPWNSSQPPLTLAATAGITTKILSPELRAPLNCSGYTESESRLESVNGSDTNSNDEQNLNVKQFDNEPDSTAVIPVCADDEGEEIDISVERAEATGERSLVTIDENICET